MKSLVGHPIQEAQIEYGPPVQIIDMPDGHKAFQFQYGGGAYVVPGHSVTTGTLVGNSVVATTTSTPGAVIESRGCLLTFYAQERGGAWIIDSIHVPKDLVC